MKLKSSYIYLVITSIFILSCSSTSKLQKAAIIGDTEEMQLLLDEKKINLNKTDYEGNTVLMKAVEAQKYNSVDLLLKRGANPNIENEKREVPLLVAILNENWEIADLLLQNGADINYKAKYNTLLIEKIYDKFENELRVSNDSLTQFILRWTNSNKNVDSLSFNFMNLFSANLSIPIQKFKTALQYLIHNGFDINQKYGYDDNTFFMFLCEKSPIGFYSFHRSILPSDLNLNKSFKLTENGSLKNSIIYETLSDNRINIDSKNKNGDTALHLSAESGNLFPFLTLNALGADVTVKNDKGQTILHKAALLGHLHIVKFCIEQLNLDINQKDSTGNTPLMSSILGAGIMPAASMFLLLNSSKELDYKKSIYNISKYQYIKMGLTVKYLLKNGALINTKNNEGKTPLMMAALLGASYFVKELLSNGADIHAVDNENKNALYYAQESKNEEVIELIESEMNK